MLKEARKLKTKTWKCPFCSKDYKRLSLSDRVHPQIKELPCFDCSLKGIHRPKDGLDILSSSDLDREQKKEVSHG